MPPMIGRAAELDTLVRALERARDGHGAVALISGEAGIGKTTLAAELRSAAESHGIVTLWGRTSEAAWAGPYAPWIEALSVLDEGAAALFQTADSLSPEDRQAQIHEQVLGQLSATVARKPALLVLDDLHWARPATLDLLRHVAFSLARSPLLIVGTYRTSAAAPHLPLGKTLGHLRREADVLDIQLTGLDRAQLAVLLESAWTERLDQILEETNGNPLFAIEIGRALDAGALAPGALRSRMTLGTSGGSAHRPASYRPAARLAVRIRSAHSIDRGDFRRGLPSFHDLHPCPIFPRVT